MGTKPVRIDNRKREKARRRRQTAAARAAVLAAALGACGSACSGWHIKTS